MLHVYDLGKRKIKLVNELIYIKRKLFYRFSFKGNATRISRLMRDSPRTFLQQAADWIEYVHRHKGAHHLRPEVFNLSWYQRYLVDVLAFLVFTLIVIICLVRLLLRYLCSIFCTRAKKRGNLKTD